jgi:nicotinamidase-related amidase
MRRPVLIIVDMQNDFLAKWASDDRERLVSELNALIKTMRNASLPIVWVRQEFEPDLSDALPEMRARKIRTVIKGTKGSEIDSRLNVLPTDAVIIKKRYSAFYGTDLDRLLESMHPDALIIAGINTHACIRTTAIDAYQRDWPVIVATDCVDSYDRDHHRVTLNYMRDKLAALKTNSEIDALVTTGSQFI